MNIPVCEDFEAIAKGLKDLEAAKKDYSCARCRDIGWVEINAASNKWTTCIACGNPGNKANPTVFWSD
jgi:hypothetical protein